MLCNKTIGTTHWWWATPKSNVQSKSGLEKRKRNARWPELIVGKYQKEHFPQADHHCVHTTPFHGQSRDWTSTLYNQLWTQAGLFTVTADHHSLSPLRANSTIVVPSSNPIMTTVVKTNYHIQQNIYLLILVLSWEMVHCNYFTKVDTHKRAFTSWTWVCCSLAWGVISAEPPILISISLGLIPFLTKVFHRLASLEGWIFPRLLF